MYRRLNARERDRESAHRTWPVCHSAADPIAPAARIRKTSGFTPIFQVMTDWIRQGKCPAGGELTAGSIINERICLDNGKMCFDRDSRGCVRLRARSRNPAGVPGDRGIEHGSPDPVETADARR